MKSYEQRLADISLALDGWWSLNEEALEMGFTVDLPGWWFDLF
jgi:hypothetical protein